MVKYLNRWPQQTERVLTARAQSMNARAGKTTARERASRAAWAVLVLAHGKSTMLTARLTQQFLDECAHELEQAEIAPPCGRAQKADGWVSPRMFRVRDLINRHRKRLQPSI
jgi:hypothetical protein